MPPAAEAEPEKPPPPRPPVYCGCTCADRLSAGVVTAVTVVVVAAILGDEMLGGGDEAVWWEVDMTLDSSLWMGPAARRSSSSLALVSLVQLTQNANYR
jgi:hypothetical protein